MNTTASNKREIKIGLLGYGFMGKAHTHAYRTIIHKYSNAGFNPKLYAIAGLGDEETKKAAIQYSFERWTTEWREVVSDPEVDVIDICLSEDMHEEVCIEALSANKHVFCEKPLALDSLGCERILKAAEEHNVKTMCGFNYRFLPAIRFAKKIIESGKLGKIYYIGAKYAQESGHDPERPADQIRYINGNKQLGTIRGLGSHLIDTVRYLCGEIDTLNADVRTMIPDRPLTSGGTFKVKADDIAIINIKLKEGGIGTLMVSALATGRKNQLALEINGSMGTVCFDLENLNVLSVYLENSTPKEMQGFTQINVTDKTHPLMKDWWPPAHILGWESGHINELYYFLDCIFNDKNVYPEGATFYDGYMAALIAQTALESSKSGIKENLDINEAGKEAKK
jgi:predicted dehydrogenase